MCGRRYHVWGEVGILMDLHLLASIAKPCAARD